MKTISHRPRVIVSATCFADADAAIKTATRLAQAIGGEVLGILVEDEAISRFAELPFAKVLAFPVAAHQPDMPQVNSRAMRIAFQRDAGDFRSILAKTARDASVDWKFESKRGQIVSIMNASARKGDFVLLGYQQARQFSGEILYISYTETMDTRLVEIGKTLASDLHVSLHTVNVIASREPEENGPIVAQKPGLTHNNFDQDELMSYLQKASPSLVLFSMPMNDDFNIRFLQDVARCSIMLSV